MYWSLLICLKCFSKNMYGGSIEYLLKFRIKWDTPEAELLGILFIPSAYVILDPNTNDRQIETIVIQVIIVHHSLA